MTSHDRTFEGIPVSICPWSLVLRFTVRTSRKAGTGFTCSRATLSRARSNQRFTELIPRYIVNSQRRNGWTAQHLSTARRCDYGSRDAPQHRAVKRKLTRATVNAGGIAVEASGIPGFTPCPLENPETLEMRSPYSSPLNYGARRLPVAACWGMIADLETNLPLFIDSFPAKTLASFPVRLTRKRL